MTEMKGKGFTVKDKRSFDEQGHSRQSSDSEAKETVSAEKEPAGDQTSQQTQQQTSQQQPPPLPINFSSFVLSLSSSALLHFGEIPDPVTNEKQRNLVLAKQTIDIVSMLKEKTAGNLTKEEEALLDNLLYDLRMRYIKESEKEKTTKQA
jgi:PBP1b-binding outer membrane lipoprotein LpoB